MFFTSPWLASEEASDSDAERPAEERVAAAIEEDIVFGRLPPGTSLREEKLEERFGFSRHIVRGALARLERLGFVVRTRNRGASVRTFSARDVEEIHDIRELLQRQAALRIALPAAEADIVRLEALEADYERSLESGDLQATHLNNERFHDALFALCGNQHLCALIRNLLVLTYAMRTRSLADTDDRARARADHRAIIALLRGHDKWALAELCVEHLRPRRDAYLDFLAHTESDPAG